MVKTLNPHKVVEEEKVEMQISGSILLLLNIWLKLFRKLNKDPTIEDAFAAGYFLGTNEVLRNKYKNKTKPEKRDNRIQNLLWK